MERTPAQRLAIVCCLAVALTLLLAWQMQASPALAHALASQVSPVVLRWIPFVVIGR